MNINKKLRHLPPVLTAILFIAISTVPPLLPYSQVGAFTLPAPQFTRVPGGADRTSAVARASFEFKADYGTAAFECMLDAFGWEPCVSGKGYANLPNGSHAFHVRYTAEYSVGDGTTEYYTSSEASYTWTARGEVRADIIPGDVTYGGGVFAVQSSAPNLVRQDTNGLMDVFVGVPNRGYARVSSTLAGGDANGASIKPSLDASGAIVAFETLSTNLVSGDTNNRRDVLIRNLQKNTIDRITNSSGAQIGPTSGNLNSSPAAVEPRVSANGAKVAYTTYFGPSSSGGTIIAKDVYIYDVAQKKTTTYIGPGDTPSISRTGRYVAFASTAKLLPADTNGTSDVYVRDTLTNSLQLVSVNNSGVPSNAASRAPDISENGRYIAFESSGNNMEPLDTNSTSDIFVRDLALNQTIWITKYSEGGKGSYTPSISGLQRSDGSFSVAYTTDAANICQRDGCIDENGESDVMQWIGKDRVSSSKTIIQSRKEFSLTAANGMSSNAIMSPDGAFVLFASNTTDMFTGIDEHANYDTYMRGWWPYKLPSRTTSVGNSFATSEPTFPGPVPAMEANLPPPLSTTFNAGSWSALVAGLMADKDAPPVSGEPNYGLDDKDDGIGDFYFLGIFFKPPDPNSWEGQFWGAHEEAAADADNAYKTCVFQGGAVAVCEMYARLIYETMFVAYADADWLSIHGIDPASGPITGTGPMLALAYSTPTRPFCPAATTGGMASGSAPPLMGWAAP